MGLWVRSGPLCNSIFLGTKGRRASAFRSCPGDCRGGGKKCGGWKSGQCAFFAHVALQKRTAGESR